MIEMHFWFSPGTTLKCVNICPGASVAYTGPRGKNSSQKYQTYERARTGVNENCDPRSFAWTATDASPATKWAER